MPSPSPDLDDRRPLARQVVVFTGKLSSLGRKDARALVARLGGVTADDVSAKTTMLVVGDEGFRDLAPMAVGPRTMPPRSLQPERYKSNKLKRAEELNAQQAGRIRILSETEFCQLAGVPTPER